MKFLFTIGAASLAATAAMAHGNAHLHPHGAEVYLAAVVVAGLGIVALKTIRK